ncbi:hypothetical protein [Fibrobacter sp.]|nr:hypothetical protein [Fibrobacter sp.]
MGEIGPRSPQTRIALRLIQEPPVNGSIQSSCRSPARGKGIH